MARLTKHIENVLTDPGAEISRGTRFVRFQLELWRFCARRLHENNLMAMSAALSFRTIFALIPLLVFALLTLKTVGVVEDSKHSLRQFLEVSGFSQIVTTQEQAAHAEGPEHKEGPDHAEEGDPKPDASSNPTGSNTTPPNSEAMPADTEAIPGDADVAPPGSADQRRVYNVADEIERVLTEVERKLTFRRVGPVGGALLIWTAITLLSTIEHSLNRIFGAPKSRAVWRKVVMYWSALTLGPVVLAVASYLGGTLVESFQGAPGASWILVVVGWGGPIVVGILFVSAVYKLLPNTQVRTRAAVGGALVAVPVWLVARWGFSLYIQHLVIKGSLYGVLGLFPLFLIWINLSWTIFLFGAQLAQTAANLKRFRLAEQAEQLALGVSDVVAAAVLVGRRFRAGAGPMLLSEVGEGINLPDEAAQSIMHRLTQAGIVCPAGEIGAAGGNEPAYTLAQPAERIAAATLLTVGDPRPPEQIGPNDRPLRAAVATVREKTQSSLSDRTLADLIDPQ